MYGRLTASKTRFFLREQRVDEGFECGHEQYGMGAVDKQNQNPKLFRVSSVGGGIKFWRGEFAGIKCGRCFHAGPDSSFTQPRLLLCLSCFYVQTETESPITVRVPTNIDVQGGHRETLVLGRGDVFSRRTINT